MKQKALDARAFALIPLAAILLFKRLGYDLNAKL